MEFIEFLIHRWFLILLRALTILGPLFLVFWILKPRWVDRFRIPQPRRIDTLTREELPRAVVGLSAYLIPIACAVIVKEKWGYTSMYLDISEYGWFYFFLSIALFAVLYDTWFYWLHRSMHYLKALKRAHAVHHRSVNVTPATSYSFDSVEALLNMMPYWFIVMVLPWHPLALFTFSMIGMTYNGYLHLGYDVGVQWRAGHPILKWFNSSTHHAIHHQRHDRNFSFYFTFWDKWMSTESLPQTHARSRV